MVSKSKTPERQGKGLVLDLDYQLLPELELSLEPDNIMIPLRLVRDQRVPAMAKLMYGILESFCEKKQRRCSPSLVEIAERSGTTLPNVPRNIRNLEEAGYVRIKRDQKRNQYEFVK